MDSVGNRLAEILDRVCVEVDFDRTDETARAYALAVALAVIEECAMTGDELLLREEIVGDHQPSKWRNSAVRMFQERIRAMIDSASEAR